MDSGRIKLPSPQLAPLEIAYGPGRNRTAVSTMRMWRLTTGPRAPFYLFIKISAPACLFVFLLYIKKADKKRAALTSSKTE